MLGALSVYLSGAAIRLKNTFYIGFLLQCILVL